VAPPLGTERRDDLRALIKECDVVTFDVFDTLLLRTVIRPIDAFRVAHELLNADTHRLVIDGVSEARVAAEAQLREDHVTGGVSPDTVTFDAIWQRAGELTDYDPELIGLLAQMELEAERRLIRPASWAVDLFRFAVDQGKEVVLVSDTYLPSAFVGSVLGDAGVTGWSALIVSCEAGAAKADGNLWAILARRHVGKRVVHIGDSWGPDVEQARAVGADAQWVPKAADALRYGLGCVGALNGEDLAVRTDLDGFRLRNLHRSVLHSLSAHLAVERPDASSATACGYGALGPLLVGYSQWLHRAAAEGGHDRLFFLARDGFLMREAYRILFGDEAVPSTYLLASRRLCNLPAIADPLTVRDIDFLTQTNRSMPMGEYFSRLGIEGLEEAARPLLERAGLSPDMLGADHQPAVRACFWQLADQLRAAADAERATLLAYWEEAGLLSARRPAVVDIGWFGSLQRSMQRVLGVVGIDLPLAGLYFGLHPTRTAPEAAERRSRRGFVDGALPADRAVHRDLILSSVSVLEFCFTRPEGTIVGLEPDEDGRLTAVHAPDAMTDADRAVLHDLQGGALEYVRDFATATRRLPGPVAHVEREAAIESMVLLLTAPTVAAADTLGRRLHGDGFGIDVTWEPIGAPVHGADHYRRHPEALEAEARAANWRKGFARNVFEMGLPVPAWLAGA
jgi:FMN phosphatase YigB (HAD superfamily)